MITRKTIQLKRTTPTAQLVMSNSNLVKIAENLYIQSENPEKIWSIENIEGQDYIVTAMSPVLPTNNYTLRHSENEVMVIDAADNTIYTYINPLMDRTAVINQLEQTISKFSYLPEEELIKVLNTHKASLGCFISGQRLLRNAAKSVQDTPLSAPINPAIIKQNVNTISALLNIFLLQEMKSISNTFTSILRTKTKQKEIDALTEKQKHFDDTIPQAWAAFITSYIISLKQVADPNTFPNPTIQIFLEEMHNNALKLIQASPELSSFLNPKNAPPELLGRYEQFQKKLTTYLLKAPTGQDFSGLQDHIKALMVGTAKSETQSKKPHTKQTNEEKIKNMKDQREKAKAKKIMDAELSSSLILNNNTQTAYASILSILTGEQVVLKALIEKTIKDVETKFSPKLAKIILDHTDEFIKSPTTASITPIATEIKTLYTTDPVLEMDISDAIHITKQVYVWSYNKASELFFTPLTILCNQKALQETMLGPLSSSATKQGTDLKKIPQIQNLLKSVPVNMTQLVTNAYTHFNELSSSNPKFYELISEFIKTNKALLNITDSGELKKQLTLLFNLFVQMNVAWKEHVLADLSGESKPSEPTSGVMHAAKLIDTIASDDFLSEYHASWAKRIDGDLKGTLTKMPKDEKERRQYISQKPDMVGLLRDSILLAAIGRTVLTHTLGIIPNKLLNVGYATDREATYKELMQHLTTTLGDKHVATKYVGTNEFFNTWMKVGTPAYNTMKLLANVSPAASAGLITELKRQKPIEEGGWNLLEAVKESLEATMPQILKDLIENSEILHKNGTSAYDIMGDLISNPNKTIGAPKLKLLTLLPRFYRSKHPLIIQMQTDLNPILTRSVLSMEDKVKRQKEIQDIATNYDIKLKALTPPSSLLDETQSTPETISLAYNELCINVTQCAPRLGQVVTSSLMYGSDGVLDVLGAKTSTGPLNIEEGRTPRGASILSLMLTFQRGLTMDIFTSTQTDSINGELYNSSVATPSVDAVNTSVDSEHITPITIVPQTFHIVGIDTFIKACIDSYDNTTNPNPEIKSIQLLTKTLRDIIEKFAYQTIYSSKILTKNLTDIKTNLQTLLTPDKLAEYVQNYTHYLDRFLEPKDRQYKSFDAAIDTMIGATPAGPYNGSSQLTKQDYTFIVNNSKSIIRQIFKDKPVGATGENISTYDTLVSDIIDAYEAKISEIEPPIYTYTFGKTASRGLYITLLKLGIVDTPKSTRELDFFKIMNKTLSFGLESLKFLSPGQQVKSASILKKAEAEIVDSKQALAIMQANNAQIIKNEEEIVRLVKAFSYSFPSLRSMSNLFVLAGQHGSKVAAYLSDFVAEVIRLVEGIDTELMHKYKDIASKLHTPEQAQHFRETTQDIVGQLNKNEHVINHYEKSIRIIAPLVQKREQKKAKLEAELATVQALPVKQDLKEKEIQVQLDTITKKIHQINATVAIMKDAITKALPAMLAIEKLRKKLGKDDQANEAIYTEIAKIDDTIPGLETTDAALHAATLGEPALIAPLDTKQKPAFHTVSPTVKLKEKKPFISLTSAQSDICKDLLHIDKVCIDQLASSHGKVMKITSKVHDSVRSLSASLNITLDQAASLDSVLEWSIGAKRFNRANPNLGYGISDSCIKVLLKNLGEDYQPVVNVLISCLNSNPQTISLDARMEALKKIMTAFIKTEFHQTGKQQLLFSPDISTIFTILGLSKSDYLAKGDQGQFKNAPSAAMAILKEVAHTQSEKSYPRASEAAQLFEKRIFTQLKQYFNETLDNYTLATIVYNVSSSLKAASQGLDHDDKNQVKIPDLKISTNQKLSLALKNPTELSSSAAPHNIAIEDSTTGGFSLKDCLPTEKGTGTLQEFTEFFDALQSVLNSKTLGGVQGTRGFVLDLLLESGYYSRTLGAIANQFNAHILPEITQLLNLKDLTASYPPAEDSLPDAALQIDSQGYADIISIFSHALLGLMIDVQLEIQVNNLQTEADILALLKSKIKTTSTLSDDILQLITAYLVPANGKTDFLQLISQARDMATSLEEDLDTYMPTANKVKRDPLITRKPKASSNIKTVTAAENIQLKDIAASAIQQVSIAELTSLKEDIKGFSNSLDERTKLIDQLAGLK